MTACFFILPVLSSIPGEINRVEASCSCNWHGYADPGW